MEKIEIEIISARKETTKEVKKYYCDLCGEEIDDARYLSVSSGDSCITYNDEYENWGSDGGYCKSYYYDLCKNCIKEKAFPLIEKKLKIKPRCVERDW